MKLEHQVCSLDLAKRLKELGVRQESYFFWWHRWEGSSSEDAGKDILRPYDSDPSHCITVASAFTVAELGEMLPGCIETENAAYANRKHPNKGMRNAYYILSTGRSDPEAKDSWFDCIYQDASQPDDTLFLHFVEAKTEADARAMMLVYLLENKLITV